jgi:photosystem II stability/assembly factor-like uncharacterized protein
MTRITLLVAMVFALGAGLLGGWRTTRIVTAGPAVTGPVDSPSAIGMSALDRVAEAQPAVWATELGGFARLEDVVAFADDDIWTVGDAVVHYDGREWRRVTAFEWATAHAIDGLSASQMWVVGEVARGECDSYGFILRFDGIAWHDEQIDTHQPLFDIAMLSATDGWAVGGIEAPVILHYDGQRWRQVGAPETGGLRALHLLDARTGWAVGDDGAIVRYNGVHWIAERSPTRALLLDVHMYDRDFGWAVGQSNLWNNYGIILVYEDGEWAVDLDRHCPALAAVHTTSRDEALAVGSQGVLLHFDGEGWREIGRTYPGGYDTYASPGAPDPGKPPSSAGVVASAILTVPGPPSPLADATARRSRVATGATVDGATRSLPVTSRAADAVCREGNDGLAPTGGGYPPWLNGNLFNALHALVALPRSETLLAVGDYGQVSHIRGGAWSEAHAGREFRAIDMLSATEGWIVGADGPPLRWDGLAWKAYPVPRRAAQLNDVVVLAADNAWAVGENGAMVHWDGTRWALAPRVAQENLTRVVFSGRDDGWTFANDYDETNGVGETIVYRYDGAAWRQAAHLCNTNLSDVVARAPDDVWFAGHGDRLLHFDGQGWTWVPIHGFDRPEGPAPEVRALAAAPDAVWAAGYGAARWDGGVWRAVQNTRNDYYAWTADRIAAVDADTFWGVDRYYRWDPLYNTYDYASQLRLFRPGVDAAVAHGQAVNLTDLDVVRGTDGVLDVWAVGEASTVVHYRASSPQAELPEPTLTPAVSAPASYPTPTPRSSQRGDDVRDLALEQLDPEGKRHVVITSVALVTEGEVERRIATYRSGPYWALGEAHFGGSNDARCYSWRPMWLVEAVGEPACTGWGSEDGPMATHAVLTFEGATARAFAMYCFGARRGLIHLPIAVGGGSDEPAPTPITRNLTPQPAADVHGPCPTPTPYPDDWVPGYP